ncbi:hypothetical protein [Streptomyces sp. Ac-502]|uniref:hypothetical protein n=1 Tax=Streptomyces sp. Ac-502 TaxID=3342801 RepID=UPI0038626FA7
MTSSTPCPNTPPGAPIAQAQEPHNGLPNWLAQQLLAEQDDIGALPDHWRDEIPFND